MKEVTPKRPSFLQEGEFFRFNCGGILFTFLHDRNDCEIYISTTTSKELVPKVDEKTPIIHLFNANQWAPFADELYDMIHNSVAGISSLARDFLLPKRWNSSDHEAREEWWK